MIMYALVHVAISLVGILSGLVVLGGMLQGRDFVGWTSMFLAATIATSLTGFGFPFEKILPSHIFGVVSLVVLAVVLFARYRRHCVGNWRTIYILGASFALYLNAFVAIVQVFLKIPVLHALAPTQSEPPFLFAQALLLVLLFALTTLAIRRMRHSQPLTEGT